jgi:hypothetical protein
MRPTESGSWGAPVAGTAPELAATPIPAGYESEAFWIVPAEASPGFADPPTISWQYLSTISTSHMFAGLVGALITANSSAALVVGSPSHGAAREYVLVYFIANENRSPFLSENVATYCLRPDLVDTGSDEFIEANLKHAINFRLSCNLDGLTAVQGETVRMHYLGLGAFIVAAGPHCACCACEQP